MSTPLTAAQIQAFRWTVADGEARIANPVTKADKAVKPFHTNAPNGDYSGEAFDLVWEQKINELNEFVPCHEDSYSSYETFENYKRLHQKFGSDTRQLLRIKPSHLPKEMTAQQYEALSDELKGGYSELTKARVKDAKEHWFAIRNADFNYYLGKGYEVQTIYRLKSQQAGQEVETVKQTARRLYPELELDISDNMFEIGAHNVEVIGKQQAFISGYNHLRTQLDQALQELEKVKREREWISVDIPPSESQEVLIHYGNAFIVAAFYDVSSNTYSGNSNNFYPTHWKPLPQPPIN